MSFKIFKVLDVLPLVNHCRFDLCKKVLRDSFLGVLCLCSITHFFVMLPEISVSIECFKRVAQGVELDVAVCAGLVAFVQVQFIA